MDRRKALKREYKENPPPGGIFQIKNLVTGALPARANGTTMKCTIACRQRPRNYGLSRPPRREAFRFHSGSDLRWGDVFGGGLTGSGTTVDARRKPEGGRRRLAHRGLL